MGDHFVLLVDRLLTESTLGAAIESRKLDHTVSSSEPLKVRDGAEMGKLVECCICQDEDEDSNIEIPCSCCGSLKVYIIHTNIFAQGKETRSCRRLHLRRHHQVAAAPPELHSGDFLMSKD